MKRVKTIGSSRDLNAAPTLAGINRNKMLVGMSEVLKKDATAVGVVTRRAALGDIGNRVTNRVGDFAPMLAQKKEIEVKKKTDQSSTLVHRPDPRKPLRSNSLLNGKPSAAPSYKPPVRAFSNLSNVDVRRGTALVAKNSSKDGAGAVMTTVAEVHRPPKTHVALSTSGAAIVGLKTLTSSFARSTSGTTMATSKTSSVTSSIDQSLTTGLLQQRVACKVSSLTTTSSVTAGFPRQSSVVSVAEEIVVEDGEEEEVVPVSDDKGPLKCLQAYSQAMIPDIDADDKNFPQLASEFVTDIYTYMRRLEEITGRMRCILIDWLVQVHVRFHLLPETMYMAVMLIDRFLQETKTAKDQLQLVGITALFVASKYEEIYAPEIGDFVYISDNTYTREQVRRMERVILRKLGFKLGRPSAIHFLRRYSKAADADDYKHTMAKFFLEVTFTEYSLSHVHPSLVAAAALWLSVKLLANEHWTPTLVHYTTYSENEVLPVVKKLCQILVNIYDKGSKFQAVRSKYASKKFLEISQHERLQSALIRQMIVEN